MDKIVQIKVQNGIYLAMVTWSNPKGLSYPLVPIKTMPKQSVFSSYNFLCTHSEANVKAESLKPKTKKVAIFELLIQLHELLPDELEVRPTSRTIQMASCWNWQHWILDSFRIFFKTLTVLLFGGISKTSDSFDSSDFSHFSVLFFTSLFLNFCSKLRMSQATISKAFYLSYNILPLIIERYFRGNIKFIK